MCLFFLSIVACEEVDKELEKDKKIIRFDEEIEPYACEQSTCWDSSVYTCRDANYNDLFTRSTGWTGGDATYSVSLNDGRTIWLFGDTFIDQVLEDRTRPSFNLINNSLVLQDGMVLTTYHGGSSGSPESYAKPPKDGHWYWPGDGISTNDKIYLFMHGFANDDGGAWDFYRTSIDLLEIDTETFSITKNTRLFDNPEISWGAAIMENSDYIYVYGVKSSDAGKHLYVARTNADLSQIWEYFDGDQWTTDVGDAAAIFEDVSEQFTVWKDSGTYYLLTQNNFFGADIWLYASDSPVEFNKGKVVYCTPETGGDIYTYNAFAHTQVYEDSLLVSYNVNSFDINDLLDNVDHYRPFFVRIGNWKEN